MERKYPFSIFKRKDSPMYYVAFRDRTTGKYLPRKSLRESDRDRATRKAFSWYYGKLKPGTKEEPVETMVMRRIIRRGLGGLSDTDKETLLMELVRQGFIKSFVRAGSRQDTDTAEFLRQFWEYDTSEYVRECRRRGRVLSKNYCRSRRNVVIRYWCPFFRGTALGAVTRQSLRDFMDTLDESGLRDSSKKMIMHAGCKALRWAFCNEYTDRDVTAGLPSYTSGAEERKIVPFRTADAIFRTEWPDRRAELANMLAMVTGLRSGEIRALRVRDIGRNCLYVNHAWNRVDGLKCPKNGSARTARLPFPSLMRALRSLGESNPHRQGRDGFVFWSPDPRRPVREQAFIGGLRRALHDTGMSDADARKYTFHGWRHFFTAYMNERVDQKILQKQTGHRTLAMLEHYAAHEIEGDVRRLETAQRDTFSRIVAAAPEITFPAASQC